MSPSASLFDPAPQPVFDTASQWLADMANGSLATSLCIIAIAAYGLLLMLGRRSLRSAMPVILGSFILLGASMIASGFLSLADNNLGQQDTPMPLTIEGKPPPPLPPARYDPYAGASLRRG